MLKIDAMKPDDVEQIVKYVRRPAVFADITCGGRGVMMDSLMNKSKK
jgi:hypothetical protein